MGPEDLLASRDPLHFTEKALPSFDGYGDNQQYGENDALPHVMTTINDSRNAPAVIGRLSSQTQTTAKTLPIEILTSAEGLARLLEDLNKTSGIDKVRLLHKNVSEFFHFTLDRSATVDAFVIGFHSSLKKILTLSVDEA